MTDHKNVKNVKNVKNPPATSDVSILGPGGYYLDPKRVRDVL